MKIKELEDLLLGLVSKQERQDKAGSYTKSILKAIKSWLAHNHRKLEIKIRIKVAPDNPR